jgi:hypothetical protein
MNGQTETRDAIRDVIVDYQKINDGHRIPLAKADEADERYDKILNVLDRVRAYMLHMGSKEFGALVRAVEKLDGAE